MSEEDKSTTSFETKCEILAELWMGYRGDKGFEDFIQYNDMGLPLAFFIAEELVEPSAKAKDLVEETFNILLILLEIQEDTGFESLDDLLVG
jgi:hypothetical protein